MPQGSVNGRIQPVGFLVLIFWGSPLRFLYATAIERPVITLLLVGIVVMVVAPGVLRLELRTDGHALVPDDRPELTLDREIRDAFLTEDVIVVLIRADEIKSVSGRGIFNTHTIKLIQELTDDLIGSAGIEPYHVSSLATEYSHRVKSGTLRNRRLLEPLPQTPRDLATLRGDVHKIGLYRGTIVSLDDKSAAIFVGVPPSLDRTETYRKILELVEAREPGQEQIDVIGAPVAEALLGSHILEDLGVPTTVLGVGTFGERGADPRWWVRAARTVGLVPVAMGLLVLVFAIGFRSLPAAMLPLMEVGACLAFVFGVMGWVGVPVYLTIAVMPVILTAIGVADEIHIFTRYAHELRSGQVADRADAKAALVRAMEAMWRPVMKTSVTTTIAFLAFGLSKQAPVRAFGLMTAVGIVFCLVFSLTAVPAMLSLIHPRWFMSKQRLAESSQSVGQRFFVWLAGRVYRMRWLVLGAAVVVIVVLPVGVSKVLVQDSWINGFSPESGFYRATQYFNDHFLGTHLLLIRQQAEGQRFEGEVDGSAVGDHSVRIPVGGDVPLDEWVDGLVVLRNPRLAGEDDGRTTGLGIRDVRIVSAEREGDEVVLHVDKRKGRLTFALQAKEGDRISYRLLIQPFMKPAVAAAVDEFEHFIRSKEALTVGGVMGTASYLRTTHYMSMGLNSDARRLPLSAEKTEWVWEQYDRIRGEDRMRQLLSPDYAQALTTVYLKEANFVDVDQLISSLREYEEEKLKSIGVSIDLAGDVAVSQTLIGAIVETQLMSLVGSFVGIFAVTAWLGKSWRMGLVCVVPCGLAVACNFAAMGWVAIPLGVATSMFAGMTLGVGVDYAIHLSERFRTARVGDMGSGTEAAVVQAVASTGPAITIDACGVALGFGVLVFSQVPANARLGGLLMLSVLTCLLTTLLVLPALLSILYRRA